MINFQTISKETFLKDYWQKKPVVIKQALPGFTSPLSADELAGLAMEDDIESKLIFETPGQTPQWHMKRGPFLEKDFSALPESHWTLVVQGVDRIIPEVNELLKPFDFLPQWRFDDVLISFASLHGSVGPHYDNYDVFLYQASGQRKWSLTTQNCNEKNALPDLELRIMANFEVEQEIVLSPGDMLYLPPHVGHHGVSLSKDCLGYSFGYRSYRGQELWDSFGDFLSEHGLGHMLYKDPDWSELSNTAEIPETAFLKAKQVMQDMLKDEKQLQQWFSGFATQLDQKAVQLLPDPLQEDEACDLTTFIDAVKQSKALKRDINSRIAYHVNHEKINLFINGYPFDCGKANPALVKMIACQRLINIKEIIPYLVEPASQEFLYMLWMQQTILIHSEDN